MHDYFSRYTIGLWVSVSPRVLYNFQLNNGSLKNPSAYLYHWALNFKMAAAALWY